MFLSFSFWYLEVNEFLTFTQGRCNVYTKKVYSREFLLQFEKRPVCQKKPDILLLNLSCLKKCDGAQVNSSSRLRTVRVFFIYIVFFFFFYFQGLFYGTIFV